MPARVTSCPNCGGQVEFRAGASLLTVCGYCSSAVARVGDDIGELEILGQVAPLAHIGSPLSVGIEGKYEGQPFTIVGRVQLDYGLGPWNEWYVAFDDERWGWLAEAQGRVYISFETPVETLPPYPHWKVGTRFSLSDKQLVVTERRKAKFVTAEGELPFVLAPGGDVFYCDVEGPGGVFGTLDFGADHDLDAVFLGRETAYGDLFAKDVLRDVSPGEAAAAVGLSCPNCGASVDLRAPNEAQRVTCPACESLLDCKKGSELFLLSAADRKGPPPLIPLGTIGKYRGQAWTAYGHLIRTVTVDGIRYAWGEYLLHNDQQGYRWLIENNGHWTWIDPISASEIQVSGLSARCRGERFRHFQSSVASVASLRGEFYWKVAIGDRTGMTDWVAPPRLLSREQSAEEVNCSVGHYLEPHEVQKIFGLKGTMKRRTGVSPNQPNPNASAWKKLLTLGVAFAVALIALGINFASRSENRLVYRGKHAIKRVKPTDKEAVARSVILTERFDVDGPSNMSIRVSSDVNNSWLYLGAALINEVTNEVRQFDVSVSYYHGYSGGESWSEGSRTARVYLGALNTGTYVLRLQPQVDIRSRKKVPTNFSIDVRSDVFLPSHLLLMLFLIALGPVVAILRYFMFEKRRWMESDHAQ